MFARIAIILVVIVIGLSTSMYRVFEQERVILFQLGEIKRADFTPGLYFLIPGYQNVMKFDGRLQTLEAEPQRFLTGEKKDVIVDSFVRWKIRDVVRFYLATGGDPSRAQVLVYQKVNDGLRNEFGKRTLQEVVAGDRGSIRNIVTGTKDIGEELGIEIVDVRLKRIDLPAEVNSSVYERMRSERSRVARQNRASGEREATTIRADADKARTVISAEAYRAAETLRGEGDAAAAKIYARAYGRNPEFYAFHRSLNAYRTSFKGKGDVLMLKPDSDFFKYFDNPAPRN
ncbi:MAG: protease modulator HflC [Gammaproteobacteria bacterium]|nr:protease modulator HflC [Gammaproteobacteria bacterium]